MVVKGTNSSYTDEGLLSYHLDFHVDFYWNVTEVEVLTLCFDFQSRVLDQKRVVETDFWGSEQFWNIPRARSKHIKFR